MHPNTHIDSPYQHPSYLPLKRTTLVISFLRKHQSKPNKQTNKQTNPNTHNNLGPRTLPSARPTCRRDCARWLSSFCLSSLPWWAVCTVGGPPSTTRSQPLPPVVSASLRRRAAVPRPRTIPLPRPLLSPPPPHPRSIPLPRPPSLPPPPPHPRSIPPARPRRPLKAACRPWPACPRSRP